MPNYHTSQPETASAIDRSVPEFPPAQPIDEELYFKGHAPPGYLGQLEKDVATFVEFHNSISHKPVVLVTSGGTTVPLENNTVRFIDNFSAGTRGATLAEYFLENGYAVIFLHREFSLLPYLRHYSHTANNSFLDYVTEKDNGELGIDPKFADNMLVVLRKYNQAKQLNSLLLVPFTTVNQYLYSLKSISESMAVLKLKAVFYLAAAVSDFFVPSSRIPQHKIQLQTLGGTLVVQLEQVPKFLRRLVDSWAPDAMIVSFKLETDLLILLQKARGALQRYQHQLVIGNLLQTRKREVVFVYPDRDDDWIRLTDSESSNDIEIESKIVPGVIAAHDSWIQKHKE